MNDAQTALTVLREEVERMEIERTIAAQRLARLDVAAELLTRATKNLPDNNILLNEIHEWLRFHRNAKDLEPRGDEPEPRKPDPPKLDPFVRAWIEGEFKDIRAYISGLHQKVRALEEADRVMRRAMIEGLGGAGSSVASLRSDQPSLRRSPDDSTTPPGQRVPTMERDHEDREDRLSVRDVRPGRRSGP